MTINETISHVTSDSEAWEPPTGQPLEFDASAAPDVTNGAGAVAVQSEVVVTDPDAWRSQVHYDDFGRVTAPGNRHQRQALRFWDDDAIQKRRAR